MSSEEFERRFQNHVEFMLEQQSRFDERLNKLEETQVRQAENLDRLAESVSTMQVEMREAINNLIVANEVTCNLAEKATILAINNSQRISP
jgi:uncharacterized membrane-anchored protein YhcB (DUF1043 family)